VIPSYDEWKKRTARGILTPRSKKLEAVDKAYKDYDKDQSPENKKTLREKLKEWMDSKDDWTVSTRNKDGIVTQVWNAVQPHRSSPSGWTAPTLPSTPKPGDIYLAPSFEYSNSLARSQVPEAFGRAKKLIDVAYRGITQARSGGPNRTIYETWFGTYDANRFSTVFNNIRALYDALFGKSLLLYYRGNDVSGPSDCPAETDALTPGGYFGAAWKPQNLPSSLDPNYTYIFLGKAFFTSGVYAQDSTGGVIIHELTHAICGTDDVQYKGYTTYGPDLCQQLAREKPQLAVHNADNYEYLCENYQSKLFVPKPRNLALPPKASISLEMRMPT
jgi:hypothetical protein